MIARGFRLKKTTDFSKTYKYGKSYNHQSFYIKALKNSYPTTRLAVVAPKKNVRRAVDRNRARRRVYEIFRHIYPNVAPGYIIIITVKDDLSKLNHEQLATDIHLGLKKLSIL